MKRMVPHLRIENCKEAIEFYQQVFGGEIQNAQLADEIEMFKGHEGKYIHAELHIIFMQSFISMIRVYFILRMSLINKYPMEMQYYWGLIWIVKRKSIKCMRRYLKKDKSKWRLQDTFWGAKHAIVKDRYGIIWELNYSK